MFIYTGTVAIALIVTTALTAALFAYLAYAKKQLYLAAWTGGWSLLTLHYLSILIESRVGMPFWLSAVDPWMLAAAALTFLHAARTYAHDRPTKQLAVAAAVVFAVWAVAYPLGKIDLAPHFGISLIFLAIAWTFWKEGCRQETYTGKLLALAFLMWAPIPILGAHYAPVNTAARTNLTVLCLVPQLFAAIVMVMAIYEEEKRRIERNMLALSNLNLATLSFVGNQFEKPLSQALERVLSVVRLPSGAIFLRHNDAHGPEAAASAGLDCSFCRAAQETQCDEQLIRLVARLGGLLVIRDIEHDSSWASLERDEDFLQLRRLAVSHGLRTVVGVSLQAKDQAFGVLLLGSPESRRPVPTELRLLMALSQQIGIAIENGYLVQQTWRRSEELHVLNEIGRALSSMLDPDALFEKIFMEIQRLFDVSNFYIALYDAAEDKVRFELEITEGVRLPKRSRPLGNHLTEYILRTRQPVLIRENYEEETRRLGAEPLRQHGSFCGVPLVVYERTIGVMAVRGTEERLFDEGHLEMMRVLGSQASIAIENARLFRGEQAKSRHLTLLNNISRSAITTLNPDEMLANITEQLGEGLAFDHIGIGLLDYENKEVIIQAEAGSRRGALGRRLALGHSLVGNVARTGKKGVAQNLPRGNSGAVLEGSASAIALPIVYADQLHGVLYVETAEETDFTEEEELLLYTLADLIAGALHNALTFQRAQEQAITDGLTGVKTHRFFTEALSAEWKRSTRAGRAFSLVLIDLDHFKLVNDYYGHLEGDLVLKRVGQILEQNCRRSDVVARYGGDEFVILMLETGIEQARQLSQKLCSRIAADAPLREKRITGSFGIATFPIHGSTPQELIQVADASMYLSKHQGGDAVSTAARHDPNEPMEWKRSVLEAYLGVTLTRLFSTGPAAFEEIRGRIEHLARSLVSSESATTDAGHGTDAPGPGGDATPTSPAVDMVTSLALAIDAMDHYTQGHSQKVAAYAALIAEELGLNRKEVEEIRLAATLHDIGKVGIPEAILKKKGPLNADEMETMKAHPRYGEQILLPISMMARICEMILHHHEMFDGSGYPNKLEGEQIPLGARIIAIADAYDTLTCDRPYQKARSSSAAVAELKRCAGGQFDPQLVRVFIAAVRGMPQKPAEPNRPPAREAVL